MTYRDILNALNTDTWCNLTEEEKIDYFQSLENHMAMESNRESCKVNGKFYIQVMKV